MCDHFCKTKIKKKSVYPEAHLNRLAFYVDEAGIVNTTIQTKEQVIVPSGYNTIKHNITAVKRGSVTVWKKKKKKWKEKRRCFSVVAGIPTQTLNNMGPDSRNTASPRLLVNLEPQTRHTHTLSHTHTHTQRHTQRHTHRHNHHFLKDFYWGNTDCLLSLSLSPSLFVSHSLSLWVPVCVCVCVCLCVCVCVSVCECVCDVKRKTGRWKGRLCVWLELKAFNLMAPNKPDYKPVWALSMSSHVVLF